MNNYLLVDGYNVIFAWEELKEMAETNLDAARLMLQDVLSELQAYTKETVILVFDGYKVKGNIGTVMKYHNVYVVFTKEAETADQYIEKVTGQYVKDGYVRVATSDWLEQIIIMGQGAERISSRDLKKEVKEMKKHLRKNYIEPVTTKRNSLIDNLSPEMAEFMKELRLKDDTGEEKKKEKKKQVNQTPVKKPEVKKQSKPLDLTILNAMDARKKAQVQKNEQDKKTKITKIPTVVDEKKLKKNELKKKKKQKKEQKMWEKAIDNEEFL